MSVFSSSALFRVYVSPQSSLRTVGSPSWQWVPHVSVDLPTATELVRPTFKTGTGSNLQGIPGRQGGAAIRAQLAFFMSGAAGTKPGMDAILQSVFANPATVVSGTSVTYSFAFTTLPFLMAVYNRVDPAATNRLAWGCIPTRATLNIGGGGYFMLDLEGTSGYTLMSDNFASETSIAKAGLSSFPAEPSASTTGNIILPYNGSVSFGGSAVAEFISAQLEISTGAASRNDGFQDAYTFATFPGQRTVTLKSLKFADSNGAALSTIKAASVSKAPMNVTLIQNASGAGYTATHTLKNIQFGSASWTDNGNSVDVDFGDGPAAASGYTALDEYTLALT
jgi:hypothetical protein